MKRFIFVAAMCFGLALPGCQDTKEDLTSPLSEKKDLYKSVGEQIPFETAMEWIAYYKKKNSEPGRTESLSTFSVSATEVNAMLGSVTDLIGVAFHYGIDNLGKTHILLIPVDGSLSLWSPIAGRIILDANSGTAISQDIAHEWSENYKTAHPAEIWFHFFGKNIFDEMNALSYFNSMDVEPAINVLDDTPELLMVIWNEELISSGRIQIEDATVYDASNPCPPCEVEE